MRTPHRRTAAPLAAAVLALSLLASILLALSPFAPFAPAASADPDDPLPRLPGHGYARVDRIGAALARDPVFVDPDLPTALPGRDLARVRRAVRGAAADLGVPVQVVVTPNPAESESQGQGPLLARLLRERTGKGGLYLVVSDRGYIDFVAFGVPRRFSAMDHESGRPPEPDRLAGLGQRIINEIAKVRNLPATESPQDRRVFGHLDPFGAEDRPLRDVEPEPGGPFLMGLLLIGPLTGGLLYGCVRLALRWRRGEHRRSATGRGGRRGAVPVKPGLRRLRSIAEDDLGALRAALASAPDRNGTSGRRATAAFDAAQLLFDDSGSDPGGAHDLVVVIVLAREGLAALDGNEPVPPCFVNPLHGPGVERRRIRAADGTRRRRVCEACATVRHERLEALTLRIPLPGGHVPHLSRSGPWTDVEYGARAPLAARVLTHLEVES